MAEVGLVHLARRKNGPAPFERFLASYRAHAAGIEHELVIVFKGFGGPRAIAGHARMLEGLPHKAFFVPDRGFDLAAYGLAAERLGHRYLCFLNSFSRILVPDWLAMLHRAAASPGVGLVGATGSYQSIAGGYTAFEQALQGMSPAARVRTRAGRALKHISARNLAQRAVRLGMRLTGVWRPARDFPPFPNHHIRTNAFLARTETLRRVRGWSARTKLAAYRFESGRESLTNQVRALGLRPLVVGRDGGRYEMERWHESNTFWQARQENLLVADNQTAAYDAAGAEKRAELAERAWGRWARPA